MIVRPERESDFAAIKEVVTDAFAESGPQVASLVERIRASAEYEPELALVAEDESEILGHVMLSWVGLVGGVQSRVLNLSPMSVAPHRQRQGIGSRLVTAALDLAEARGEPVVIVEGIPAYYPRFGFERASPLGFEPPHAGIPADAFMVKRLSHYDAAVRGRIVYPPAFDIVAQT